MSSFQTALKAVTDFSRNVAILTNPMAVGTDSARTLAKGFANEERRIAYHLTQIDDMIRKKYSPAERAEMGRALDEQSVMDQKGEKDPAKGLGRLTPDQRAVTEMLSGMADTAWQRL